MSTRQVPAASCAVAFALLPRVTLAQNNTDLDRYGYGPHMMWSDGGWPMFFFGPLFMILVLAAVVAAVVLVVRGVNTGPAGPAPRQSSHAIEILKERYARGEIDKAEFEERRRVLGE